MHNTVVGVIVALVILLPEGLAALRAARKNRLQTSLNLALGSALASIGLTIPAVAIMSYSQILQSHLALIQSLQYFLFYLYLRSCYHLVLVAPILQGVVLLVIFAVYLFTTIVP